MLKKLLYLMLCAGSLSHAVVTTMDVVSEGEAIIYSSPPFHLHYNRDIGVTDILSIHPNTLNILDEIDGQYLVWLSVVTGEAYNYLPIAIQSLYDSASPATAVDETTNGYDALYVDNVGAAFDGAATIIDCGNSWQTQNPEYWATFNNTVGDIGFRQVMARRSNSAGSGSEAYMGFESDGTLSFAVWLDDVVVVATTDLAITQGVYVQANGWYNRAGGEIGIRYRYWQGASWGAWVSKTTTAPTTGTLDGATKCEIGNATYSTGVKFQGEIFDVQVWDYATQTQLHGYPLCENSGTTAYDVIGSADGTITVGAGGESAFWAPRQGEYAYMPLYGGTVALDVDTSLQVVSTASTGTKSLTQKFLFKADDDATLFTSNSKSLTATHLETDPAGLMTIYYDGTPVGSGYVGDRITITTDVDIGASLSIGATGVGDWEWLSTTVADNGGWKAELYDVSNDLVKNTDSTKGDALVAGGSGVYQKQYPALSDGSDDVAGLGLLNPPARHNGGIYNIQQATTSTNLFDNAFWYDASTNALSKTYLDFKTHLDGSNYVWNIWANTTGVCVADKIITTTDLTPTEFEGMESLRTPACSAGVLEALKDVDGEYITDVDGYVITTVE